MDVSNITFIPLSHRQFENYRRFAIDSFMQTFDRYNSPENMRKYVEKAFKQDVLMEDLDPAASAVLLACCQGQTVGYIKLNFPLPLTHGPKPYSVELERIYVDAAWQGKKLGALLLGKAVEAARERAADSLWLGVWEHNPKAIAFYERNGFVRFGSHDFLLGDERQTDLLMRLELYRN